MTILVTKGVRISADNYTIDLTALELEHLRDVLRFVPTKLQASKFANECADIMSASLVLNGE